MIEIIGPVLFVIFAWWFSTGAVILLARLGREAQPWTMLASGLVLAGSLFGLHATSAATTTENVVIAFCCVIGIWAWHELTFLLGVVTGPRREPCPGDAAGWSRFSYAFAALRHHELALVGMLLAIIGLTWNGDNIYGLAAFALLWIMRLSAKLNLFFGVPHFSVDVLPERLAYLSSYFRKRPVTQFYLISVSVGLLVAGWLIGRLTFAEALSHGDAVGTTILATLLLLAVLEHLFMATSIKDIALWKWALIDVAIRPDGDKPHLQSRGCDRVAGQRGGAKVENLAYGAAVAHSVGDPKNGL